MIGQQGNLLNNALAAGEMAKFLIGDPPYFFEAKSDNPEPQNVQEAFDLQITRYWAIVRDPSLPSSFVDGLGALLDTYPDRDKAIYVVNNWLYTYFAAHDKKRTQAPLGIYSELFDVDLSPVTDRMRIKLLSNRSTLISDTRWAGALWNSPNGLWGPIVRTAKVIREKLNGPDYLPQNVL